ncbi:hypothetical protein N431DRAFT_148059 [Stipitochalara longipes BDJ]|nr:hypothetical protein N431DRAFT_148059 [Stipitochalara longipes BDJ]
MNGICSIDCCCWGAEWRVRNPLKIGFPYFVLSITTLFCTPLPLAPKDHWRTHTTTHHHHTAALLAFGQFPNMGNDIVQTNWPFKRDIREAIGHLGHHTGYTVTPYMQQPFLDTNCETPPESIWQFFTLVRPSGACRQQSGVLKQSRSLDSRYPSPSSPSASIPTSHATYEIRA